MKENNNQTAAENTAETYVAQRLEKARQNHKRTRLIGTVLICGIALYIGTISYVMIGFFQPDQAARVASGMLTQRVEQNGPILAAKIEEKIPELLHQTPDYLKQQLPVLRQNLQAQLENEFRTYCATLSANLGDKMDKFIDDHKAEIKTLLENSSDRAAIRKALPSFDSMVADFVQNDVDGRELKKHIDDLAAALKDVEKRMDRLANASSLSPDEQKARHALAAVAKVASSQAVPTDLTTEEDEDSSPAKKAKAHKAVL